MLLAASVTSSLVTIATNVVRDAGLGGVAAMTTSSAVIGLPGTELTMLFAGFNVFHHHLTLLGIITFGVIGDLVGATIAYAIGFFGLHELLERKASTFHIGPKGLSRAHVWFGRYGDPAIVISRLIPVIRAAFPYAAGVARMPYLRFILLTLAGSIVWIGGLGLLGRAVGSQWNSWRAHLEYVDYAAAVLLACAVAWVIVRLVRGGGGRATPA